ncbi:MAG TPA: hypothetical protein VIV58_10420 [Kofleriaceae bacterium]
MQITNKQFLAALTTSLLIAACGGSKPQPAAPPPASTTTPAHHEMAGMCPLEVAGTQVAAADTADGAAMTFTTTGDVANLRQRVHHMAEMHDHMMGGGMMTMKMKMVPSTARAEDIDGGARIVLTPKDPAQLSELRAHVHEHATMMASGHCPMMGHENQPPSA